MDPIPSTKPPSVTPWQAQLVADGPASLALRRWPVLVVLTHSDSRSHAVVPRAVLELRLRAPEAGVSLRCQEHLPPNTPRLAIEPGAEVRLPLDLFDWLTQPERLAPGEYRVEVTLSTDLGPLVIPRTRLSLAS